MAAESDVEAARRLAHGIDAITSSPDAAPGAFADAVRLDPGMADAWLARYVVCGRDRSDLEQALNHEDRIGRDFARVGRTLRVDGAVGRYSEMRLVTADDLRLALAWDAVRRGRYDQAVDLLRAYAGPPALGAFVAAGLEEERGLDLSTGEHLARDALACWLPDEVAVGAELVLGACLARQGRLVEALLHLGRAESTARTDAQRAQAMYLRGLILREQDDAATAAQVLRAAAETEPLLGHIELAARDPLIGLRLQPGLSPDQVRAGGAVDRPLAAARADLAAGMAVLREDPAAAAGLFERAAGHDPALADAYLGCIAAGAAGAAGAAISEAYQQLVFCSSRVGEDLAVLGLSLTFNADIAPFLALPSSEPQHVLLAAVWRAVTDGDLVEATSRLERYHGEATLGHVVRAWLENRRGEAGRSVETARHASNDDNDWVRVSARLALGIGLAQLRRFDEASEVLLSVERQDASEPAMAEAAHCRALVLRALGDQDGATELLRSATALAPEQAHIRAALEDPSAGLTFADPPASPPAEAEPGHDQATGLFAAGVDLLADNRPAALSRFRAAAELDPAMTDAWLGVYAAGGDAAEALERMRATFPRLGETQAATGRRLEARANIGGYVTLPLNNADQVRLCYAFQAIEEGNFALASSALRHAQGPPDQVAFVLARQHWIAGDLDRAIEWARRAQLGRDPYVAIEAGLVLGICLARLRRFDDADAELAKVAEQDSLPLAVGEAEFYRAMILRARGNQEAAEAMLRRALEHKPDFEVARTALADPAHGLIFVNDLGGRETQSTSVERVETPPAQGEAVARTPRRGGAESLDALLAELDGWIGLGDLKREIRVLVAQTKGNLARARHGLPQDRLTQHLVFVGPPGTGKTSIARLVARIYHALGVLERPDVVEADRSSLVGPHLGTTALKTNALVDQALGGVLFVDEAYSLEQQGLAGGDAFGSEAVDTLVKRMEDERDHLVVVVAGYPEPMAEFLRSNEGLASRFTATFRFPAYSASELVAISTRIAGASGAVLADGTHDMLLDYFERVIAAGEVDRLGNGRLARNVVERAQRERDYRLFDDNDVDHEVDVILTIEVQDVFEALSGAG